MANPSREDAQIVSESAVPSGRGRVYDKTVVAMYREFLDEQPPGKLFRAEDAIAWFQERYPKVKEGTVRAHLTGLSTNVPARVNYAISDLYEYLYRVERGVYRAYDPEQDPPPIRARSEKREGPTQSRSWLFQANPTLYDLRGALAELTELTWEVKQYKDRIAPGDRVFLWESGKEGGLLAEAEVVAGPEPMGLVNAEQEYVRDGRFEDSALRVRLRVVEVLDEPVDRETLRSDPRLADLGFLAASQGTNFALTGAHAAALLDHAHGARVPRVVKIAPGEGAKFWDECLEGGYICVGWDDVGDLSQYEDFDAFRAAFAEHYLDLYNGSQGTVTKKAKELWTLGEIQPGDRVVANRGISEVLAVGEVLEPGYVHRPERDQHQHTVNVRWDTSLARTIPKQQYWGVVTVADVPVDLYAGIVKGKSGPPAAETASPAPATRAPTRPLLERVTGALQDAGLTYGEETVSTYLLALQTKRFVILSGISGTGKTQIALAVARALQSEAAGSEIATVVPEGAYEIEARPYMLKYGRMIVPARLLSTINLPAAFERDGKAELEVAFPEGRQSLLLGTSPGTTAATLLFKGALRRWFQKSLAEGDTFYVDVEPGENHDRLTLGLPQAVRRRASERPRYVVTAVRPDWTDNRGLLGYFNPILQHYVSTPFLRLLLDADAEQRAALKEGRPAAPYFAILDEMNLARVEHYFADFLSCLESGEPLELHEDEAVASGEKGDGRPIPRRLRIPPNVFFVGTVNVDETTYMFSPKVLDRAFTLELNQVDLAAFDLDAEAADAGEGAALRLPHLPDHLEAGDAPSAADWQALGALEGGRLRKVVLDLHDLLRTVNRHFGYRVANEIGRFVRLAAEQGDGEPASLWAALDLAVLMKVLPKLHGTQQELEELLAMLFTFAVTARPEAALDPDLPFDGWLLDGDRLQPPPDGALDAPVLPRTAAKLWRMQQRLRRQGFTSFIE